MISSHSALCTSIVHNLIRYDSSAIWLIYADMACSISSFGDLMGFSTHCCRSPAPIGKSHAVIQTSLGGDNSYSWNSCFMASPFAFSCSLKIFTQFISRPSSCSSDPDRSSERQASDCNRFKSVIYEPIIDGNKLFESTGNLFLLLPGQARNSSSRNTWFLLPSYFGQFCIFFSFARRAKEKIVRDLFIFLLWFDFFACLASFHIRL